MLKNYVVYPGEIRSLNDNDVHFITYSTLIKLYKVNPHKCINYDAINGYSHEDLKLLVPLAPNMEGNYDLMYRIEKHHRMLQDEIKSLFLCLRESEKKSKYWHKLFEDLNYSSLISIIRMRIKEWFLSKINEGRIL